MNAVTYTYAASIYIHLAPLYKKKLLFQNA